MPHDGVRSPHDAAERAPRVARWDKTTKIVVSVILLVLAALAFSAVRVVFIPLIIGMIMAYLLTPLVRWLCARTPLSRGLATGIVYLLLLGLLAPAPAALAPWAVRQVNQLRQELIQFVAYLDTISTDTVSVLGFNLVVGDIVAEVTDTLRTVLSEFGTSAFNVVFGAAEVLLLTIFTFLIGFYLTRDAEKVKDWLTGIIPPDYRSDVLKLVAEVDKVWSAFFRGQVILAVVVGVLLTLVASVLGLPQPALLGVLGGLMEFLPSVGHAIWLITASILALIEGSSTLPVSNGVLVLIVIAVHTAYTQFDLNYLIPRIIGRQVHLHPMVVIIGIIVGASLGGVLGVALAAPTIASARILGRYLYARLFDLDPFPMVGPPSAPRPVRERHEAALDASDGPATALRSVVRRARRQTETETPEEPV